MGKQCFVVCPISEEGSDTRKRSDDLLDYIITPACECTGYDEPIRVDRVATNGRIDSEIIRYLTQAELVIADISEQNPNVFYELGYRAALQKPLIQLIRDSDSIPFDVSTTRTIKYTISDLRKADAAKTSLIETITKVNEEYSTIASATSSPASVEGSGLTQAQQILKLLFDVKNSLDDLSVEVHKSNQELVEQVMRTSLQEVKNAAPKSSDQVLMEALVPAILQNPDSLIKLAEIADKFGSNN